MNEWMNGGPLLASNETMREYDVHELIKTADLRQEKAQKLLKQVA